MAAQVVSIAMSNPRQVGDGTNKIVISWTSATGGTVSADICSTYRAQTGVIDLISTITGYIVKMATNPGATAPTANYDIVLNDEDGIDLAEGNLSDRHTSNSEQYIPETPPFVDGEISLAITNAGDAKTGTLTLIVVKKP